MNKKIVFVLVLTMLVSPIVVSAANLHAGERYTLSSSQTTQGNLYTASGDTLISGNVNGDLMGVSGNFLITGDVQDDVSVAAGTVNVVGDVNGDLRFAGGNITITGNVNGDLAGLGGQTHIASGTTINGDLLMLGGVIFIDGDVKGDVKIMGGEVIVNGVVSGSITTRTDKLVLLENADVKGSINHTGVEAPEINEGAVVGGEVNFSEKQRAGAVKSTKRNIVFGLSLIKLILTLVGALVIFWIFKSKLNTLVQKAVSSFGGELLRGLILAIVLPIATILVLITVIGVPLGIALGLFYGLMIVLAKLLSGVVFGAWVAKTIKKPIKQVDWRVVVGGVIGLHIIVLIPFIGWIIGAIFCLATFGSLNWHIYRALK